MKKQQKGKTKGGGRGSGGGGRGASSGAGSGTAKWEMVTGGGGEAEGEEEEQEKGKKEKKEKKSGKRTRKSLPQSRAAPQEVVSRRAPRAGLQLPACPARNTAAIHWRTTAPAMLRANGPAKPLLDCCSHPAPRLRAVQSRAWTARGMLGAVVRAACGSPKEGAAGRAGLPVRPATYRCLFAVAAPSGSGRV